jgi:hypothetical protein
MHGLRINYDSKVHRITSRQSYVLPFSAQMVCALTPLNAEASARIDSPYRIMLMLKLSKGEPRAACIVKHHHDTL